MASSSKDVEMPGRSEGLHVDKGLKPNAIGFWDGLAIGLDSTAPAYSLAAVLGSLVAVAGTQAPAVMLVSFVPIFLIAGAFFYMNRADQDCGTTFSWVTRAMGPTLGWLGGWAVFTTGVLVIGSLADVAALYTFELFGLTALSESRLAVVIFAVVIILVMTWLCVIGTEVSAKVQRVLVLAQVAILLIFVVVALVQLATGSAPEGAVTPELSWLSPVGLDSTSLISGVLLAVFIYWGWESAVNLTEESTNSATSPGKAGLVSTLVLLVTYVGVAVAMIAVVGPEAVTEYDDDTALFGAVGEVVLGPLAFLLILAIITSGLASTQTTILPASRTSLSMAVAGAFPKAFAKVHPKFGTPAFGTWAIGIASIVWYVAASWYSEDFLFDSLSALSLLIAFYYALTGVACAIYWRRRLTHSVKSFLFIGLGPVVGALMLGYLLVQSVIELANPEESYTGSAIFGIGLPLAIALFFIILGVVLMIIWRLGPGKQFFTRKGGEHVSDEVALSALGPTAPGLGARRDDT
jgi:amino acid transporter